mmetsp:Transcript_9812/g.14721  ORF Transcript_9812/g.14721 Transcript_9812/m.14721 type:complete len:102 (-) Transcript_9812:50-355(-)
MNILAWMLDEKDTLRYSHFFAYRPRLHPLFDSTYTINRMLFSKAAYNSLFTCTAARCVISKRFKADSSAAGAAAESASASASTGATGGLKLQQWGLRSGLT